MSVLDPALVAGSFFVAIIVGLTGMGGGALMTPMMMLFFNVPPLAAVSSDLVASAVMKPVGGLVHLRRGTVHLPLVGWLCVGSVPAAFAGVLIMRALGDVQEVVKYALGIALLLAVAGLVGKALLGRRSTKVDESIHLRPIPTVLIGMVGGVIVGMTSVGSGSLIIVMLLVVYPMISANQLVGTDLLQAVPLVMSAAFGHLLFGDFQLDLTASLLLGSIPGVYLGARISSWAPGHVIRPILAVVLFASALKLLGVSNTALLWWVAGFIAAGAAGWLAVARMIKPSTEVSADT
ncbi:sulfite exporter TauE/SafE family protein [Acrocarpospora catenulata]|uniref:sulfite exporter TauE/SafE family protein n=1 Tax=Acrocarpospora catenulata TaxID=2836182 RepID=UPI001BDA2F62|nr:sulfite exporter TauE/SafE family protein [Acrocarpospora catenulata]